MITTYALLDKNAELVTIYTSDAILVDRVYTRKLQRHIPLREAIQDHLDVMGEGHTLFALITAAGCADGASSVRFRTVAGAFHYIRIGGAAGGGPGSFDISCQQDCFGDFNGDRNVDGLDLGVLLSQWGQAGSADLNGDGSVDGIDLGSLLSRWGLGCT